MLCRIGGSILRHGGGVLRRIRGGLIVLEVLVVVLLRDRSEGGRQGRGVDRVVSLCRHKKFFDGAASRLQRGVVAIMGTEELLREGDGARAERRRSPRHDARAALHLAELLDQGQVGLLDLSYHGLEFLVPLLQGLDLETLAFPR
jgi:hypothetical protein